MNDPFLPDKPSLNQISSFITLLEGKENYKDYKNLNISDFERMTFKQYKYLLYLILDKQPVKAKEILNQILKRLDK